MTNVAHRMQQKPPLSPLTRIGHDLVGNEDGDAKFLGQARQLTQELSHLHLALGKFAASHVVGTKEGRGGIDDEQGVAVLTHNGGGDLEEFHLVFRVVRTGASHVFEGDDGVESKALGNGLQAAGTKSSFRVNVNGLSFGAALGDGQLASDAQGVAELGLAGAEFSKDFGDGARLDAPLEQLV